MEWGDFPSHWKPKDRPLSPNERQFYWKLTFEGFRKSKGVGKVRRSLLHRKRKTLRLGGRPARIPKSFRADPKSSWPFKYSRRALLGVEGFKGG